MTENLTNSNVGRVLTRHSANVSKTNQWQDGPFAARYSIAEPALDLIGGGNLLSHLRHSRAEPAPSEGGGGNLFPNNVKFRSTTMKPQHQIKQAAFTLVELLVVISIITLLISILLPALAAARDAARSIQCMSNQRQIGLAHILYTQDHNDSYVPFDNIEINSTDYTWVNLFRKDYVQDLGVWLCPNAPEQRDYYNSHGPGHDWDSWSNLYVSYGYNRTNIGASYRYNYSHRFTPARVYQIYNSGQTILTIDSYTPSIGQAGAYTCLDVFTQFGGQPGIRHQGGVNILWIDGHVSNVRIHDKADPYGPDDLGNRTNQHSLWDRN